MNTFALSTWPFPRFHIASYDIRAVLSRACVSSEKVLDDGALPPHDLVSRIMLGDSAAEAELYNRYGRGVRTLLSFNTRTPDVADDMLQDTFVTVLGKIRRGEVRDPEKLRGFIHSVAQNLATKHYSREAKRRADPDIAVLERLAADLPGPLELADRDQTVEVLHQAIDELPMERDRLLLKRHFFDGASVEELCAELGEERRHCYRVKHRAITRLIELTKGRLC